MQCEQKDFIEGSRFSPSLLWDAVSYRLLIPFCSPFRVHRDESTKAPTWSVYLQHISEHLRGLPGLMRIRGEVIEWKGTRDFRGSLVIVAHLATREMQVSPRKQRPSGVTFQRITVPTIVVRKPRFSHRRLRSFCCFFTHNPYSVYLLCHIKRQSKLP
jgi:hypothetical protein